jgi:hypothetical protein
MDSGATVEEKKRRLLCSKNKVIGYSLVVYIGLYI